MSKKPKAAAPAAAAVEDWDTAPAETTITANDDGVVRVKCIVATKPWTDTKPLALDEEADVPVEVARAMHKNGQVEIL